MAVNTKKIQSAIIDASFALSFLLPDEKTTLVDEVFDFYKKGKITLYSTSIFSFEVLNALKTAVLRNRINKKDALKLTNYFLDLSLKINIEPVNLERTFKLALQHNLSFYDASYLELSLNLKKELLTLDNCLKSKALK